MIDVKQQLLKVKQDPGFSHGEKSLAETLLDRIEDLENQDIDHYEMHHWTEMARFALLIEIQNQVIGKQAAAKIYSFLKRHGLDERFKS
jgi:hypothetical protein